MQLDSANATPETLKVMDHAVIEAKRQGHAMVGLGHILTSIMIRPQASSAGRVLARQEASTDAVRRIVKGMYMPYVGKEQTITPYDHPTRDAISRAITIAHYEGDVHTLVRPEHLLRGLIEEADAETERLFEAVGINQWKVQAELKQVPPTGD